MTLSAFSLHGVVDVAFYAVASASVGITLNIIFRHLFVGLTINFG
jgi:hypothetical protein